MRRDWFWQLNELQQGPDWFFVAAFAPTDGEQLAASVRQQPPPGFTYYRAIQQPCRQHGQIDSYDLYVDQGNYAALVANFESDEQRNIWIYHTIEICGADLAIERGYGGYPAMHGIAETDLIVLLAHSPDLTLISWDVRYGGQGYRSGSVASGTTAAELLSYLRAN